MVKALQAVCHWPGLFQNCCLTSCLTGGHHRAGADARSMASSRPGAVTPSLGWEGLAASKALSKSPQVTVTCRSHRRDTSTRREMRSKHRHQVHPPGSPGTQLSPLMTRSIGTSPLFKHDLKANNNKHRSQKCRRKCHGVNLKCLKPWKLVTGKGKAPVPDLLGVTL